MRNGNEEIRNGNEEMRLSTGKFVHASRKLAHCIDFCSQEIMAELMHCKSYCPYRLWAVRQIRDWSRLTWAVKTEPSDRLDGDGCLYSLNWTTGHGYWTHPNCYKMPFCV